MLTYKALIASQSDNDPNDFKNIKCEWQEIPLTPPAPHEVQIRVHYSSLNYKDALAITGRGKILRSLPLTPGIDAAGTVTASLSKNFKEGDQVLVTGCGLGEVRSGGLSEIITVPDSWVIPLPSSLTLKESMILGTAGFTAGLALYQLEKNDLTPQKGDVLITGATGGVGCLSLLLLKSKGYTLTAWSRKSENKDLLFNWGASHFEDISQKDFQTRFLESGTWAAAIDNVGGDILSFILPRIKPHGSVATIGLAQSAEFKTSVFPFILRGVNMLGISSATCPRPLREEIWKMLSLQKIDWSTALRKEISANDVIDECKSMILGKTWGRVIVNMQKG